MARKTHIGASGCLVVAMTVLGCEPGAVESGGPPLAPPAARLEAADAEVQPLAPEERSLPALDDRDILLLAHHLRLVTGEPERAREQLTKLLADTGASGKSRGLAALELAEMAELAGQRRVALGYLEMVKTFAGPFHALALEAEDRRARILTVTPLADVRGPVPGSLTLEGESAQVGILFRKAERQLTFFHRVVVAPSLENVNAVLRAKRRTLARAVSAYQLVIRAGGGAARAAAQFRIGAMYHHLAEALAFESPEELLPSEARRLTRKLRAESAAYLRKALVFYRSAGEGNETAGSVTWQKLARQEADTLATVLKRKGKPSGK